MQVGYRHKSRFWCNSWLSKIDGRAKCQKHLPTTKLSIWHSRPRTTGYRSIAGLANYEVTTRSSAVVERPRDASCLSVVSFNIQRSFLLVVTAASDLLVHKILLNFVLLSPIVSGGVRPKLPGQTPLHHKLFCPLFAARGSVGVRTPLRGSDRVRSTG